jgi:hypothetical protein
MENGQSGTDGVDGNRPGDESTGGWMFPALLAVVLLAAVLLAAAIGLLNRQAAGPRGGAGVVGDWVPSAEPEGETVSLEIDFGNGARKQFAALPWRAGLTAADLMQEARDFRPGIDYTQVGTGASGLLTSLDGLKNKGASGRNWVYRIVDLDGDKRYGEVSFCLQPLEPGMGILWEFATGGYNDESTTETTP